MARTKIGKHFTLSEDVVKDLENEENQSQTVEELLRDAGYGDGR